MSAALVHREPTRRLPLAHRAAVEPLANGAVLPGSAYRVLNHVVDGGMGQLFAVEHAALGRRALLKTLLPSLARRAELADRLTKEGRILASLSIPGVPAIFDAGELCDGRPFLVLEHLPGSNLRDELRRHRVFSVPAVVRIGVELLNVLAAVHAAGVLHRDIKLDNVLLGSDGRVSLIDFGIAKRFGERLSLTAQNVAFGTPRFMAPEQCKSGTIDERADLYAVGLVLYELAAGVGPFDDACTVEAQRYAHEYRTPEPPSRLAPQLIPAAIDRVILRALAKRPQARFESALDMLTALEQAAFVGFGIDDAATDLDVFVPSCTMP
ncbi:MAG: serine/threonine-protein kinase [Polyangiaceae bacterium]